MEQPKQRGDSHPSYKEGSPYEGHDKQDPQEFN